VKIGLIARSEHARGLAIQSKGFYDNMPVDRVLLVKMPRPDCRLADDWYPGATVVNSLPGHTLNETLVRDWLDGLDVVFSAETPYDWRLPGWARQMGVRTVIQGNPEFTRHGLAGYDDLEPPDEWWWPTHWRLDKVPAGRVMPVPMPHRDPAPHPGDEGLRVYHVVGQRAFADRNGTDVVMRSLSLLRGKIDVTLYALDASIPAPGPTRVRVRIHNEGMDDRWAMHAGQHLLVLPRRYGGLCLPALEAAACGVAVLMSACSPNDEFTALTVSAPPPRTVRLAGGDVQVTNVHPADLASSLNWLAGSPDVVAAEMRRAWSAAPRWDEWRPRYLAAFAELL